jgi:hypothetical protein
MHGMCMRKAMHLAVAACGQCTSRGSNARPQTSMHSADALQAGQIVAVACAPCQVAAALADSRSRLDESVCCCFQVSAHLLVIAAVGCGCAGSDHAARQHGPAAAGTCCSSRQASLRPAACACVQPGVGVEKHRACGWCCLQERVAGQTSTVPEQRTRSKLQGLRDHRSKLRVSRRALRGAAGTALRPTARGERFDHGQTAQGFEGR